MNWWFRLSLTTKIFTGMLVGMIVGLVYPPIANLKFVGDIFIRFIQVAIVPLVFSVLVVSMASINLRSFGRLGVKVMFFYTFTTVVATIVGVVLANIMQPGAGLDPTVLSKLTAPKPVSAPPLAEIFLNMVPANIVDAAAKGTMIQIVVFAIFFGLIIGAVGKKAEPVRVLLEGLYQIMVKMVWAIMEMAPYAVFALMAWLTAVTGVKALLPLTKYILATIIGMTFQTFIVVSIFVALIARVNPWQFYKRSLDYMMVAFTTRSSAASLPIALQVAEQKLGIHPRIAGFALPLGSVMNQDGSAIWWPIAAMFIAQLYGLPITLEQQIYLVVLVNLIGLGSTGIPSGGIILLAMILTGMGWPVEGIALIIGVDVIPDMFRTTLNVIDDLSGALMVAATEKGMLRRDILSGERELTADEITFTGAEQG
jgi:proton glutamate symport protein